MSISKKVVSDSIVTAVRILVTTIRGLIVIPIITNLLGAGSYGIWTTVLALTSLIKSTGSFHLHGALIRYGSQDSEKEETYVDIITLVFFTALLIALGVFLVADMVDLSRFLDGEVENEKLLIVAACFLIFASMTWLINLNFPRSKGHVKLYDTLRITKQVIESIGLVIVFLLGGGIVAGIFLLGGISMFLSCFLFGYIVYSYELPRPSVARYSTYLKYSMPLIPQIISKKLMVNADKFLILYFLSPAAVGIYAVGYAVSSLLNKFTTVLNPTLYPTISEAWDEENYNEISILYGNIFRGYFIFGIPALAGLIILADQLLTLLSTADIAEEGVVLIPILALGFLAKGGHNPLTFILTAAEKTERIAVVIIFGTILNVTLNIIFIPQFGIIGAAYATAISASSIFVFMYYYATLEIPISIPYRTLVRSTIAAVVMSIVLFLMPQMEYYIQLFLFPPIGVVVYFSILIFLGEITKGDIKKINVF